MNYLTSWLLSVIGTAFLVSICEALMPDEKVRQVGHLVGGLLMLLVLVTPLLQLRPGEWNIGAENCFRQVEEKKLLYHRNQAETFSDLIKERTETYIETAARSRGLSVHAQVDVAETDSGVPRPESVTLDIPNHAARSAQIAEELGILPQDQHWLAKETG